MLIVASWLRILRSFSDPQNFSSHLTLPCVVVAVVVSGQAGQRSSRELRGKLNEAKIQGRPHSERKSEIWRRWFTFVVSLFLYFSLSRARRRPKAGLRFRTGGGVRGPRCERRRLRQYCGRTGGRCTPVHPAKEVSKYDGPSKGPVLKGVEGSIHEAKLVEKCCITYGVFGENEWKTPKNSVLHWAFDLVYSGILRVRMQQRNG